MINSSNITIFLFCICFFSSSTSYSAEIDEFIMQDIQNYYSVYIRDSSVLQHFPYYVQEILLEETRLLVTIRERTDSIAKIITASHLFPAVYCPLNATYLNAFLNERRDVIVTAKNIDQEQLFKIRCSLHVEHAEELAVLLDYALMEKSVKPTQ